MKGRVTYSKEMRKAAKAERLGLVTIHVEFPDGTKLQEQGTMHPRSCHFARWVAAVLFCPELRDLPDIEAIIQNLIKS